MSTHEIIVSCLVAIPVAFLIGRYSTKVAFFHTKTEHKLTVPEFVRGGR